MRYTYNVRITHKTPYKEKTMKYQLEINGARGYSASQVDGITVAELIDILEQFNEDDVIVLHDGSNRYGASFGFTRGEINECEITEEDEE